MFLYGKFVGCLIWLKIVKWFRKDGVLFGWFLILMLSYVRKFIFISGSIIYLHYFELIYFC